MQQQALFANFESSNSANGWALLAANKTKVLSTVMCPSDPSSPKTDTLDGNTTTAGVFEKQGMHTNYVTCTGSTAYGTTGKNLNGIFYVKSKTKIIDIKDILEILIRTSLSFLYKYKNAIGNKKNFIVDNDFNKL